MAIASCLVDTNILLRATRRFDSQHKIVSTALASLLGQGAILYCTHQNIAELWNAMTRPVDRNGLGLSASEADKEVRAIEDGNARLASSMYIHRVNHILTLNVADFNRLDGLTAVHPETVPAQ